MTKLYWGFSLALAFVHAFAGSLDLPFGDGDLNIELGSHVSFDPTYLQVQIGNKHHFQLILSEPLPRKINFTPVITSPKKYDKSKPYLRINRTLVVDVGANSTEVYFSALRAISDLILQVDCGDECEVNVVGLDFNFLALNIYGFTCYSIFNCALYWSPVIQREYLDQHPFGKIPVLLNDVIFSLHAAFACIITIVQCFIYERGTQQVAKLCISLISLFTVFASITLILTLAHVLTWLKYVEYLSYIKLVVTLIKYIPQALYNFKRKSTVGWSIGNVLLDFTGGTFSVLQMFFFAYNYNDWSSIFGDFTKFGLGAFSLAFDIVFMFQHYVLYRSSVPYDEQKDEDDPSAVGAPVSSNETNETPSPVPVVS